MNQKEHIYFIVSDKHFPHGDAGGNRIEYMAKCILDCDLRPFVISLGNEQKNKSIDIHNDITFENVNNKSSFINDYIFSGFRIGRLLRKNAKEIARPYTVLAYSSNPIFLFFINIFKKRRAKIIYDVVEWDDNNSFKYGKLNPRYWLNKISFNIFYPKGSGIIAISKNIKDHFTKMGCKTHLFPICLDAAKLERDYCLRNNDGILKLIYSGNPNNKDDIATVIKSVTSLRHECISKIEFHFTGVTKEQIETLLGKKKNLLTTYSSLFIFHKWMNYEDLIKLYYSVDALILFRYDNLVCRSNFPSKVPELLSCGVFIIANNCGDFFNFLSVGNNVIEIEQNTVQGCIDAIYSALSLSADEKITFSRRATECAKNVFNYKNYSSSLANFILRINES